MNQFLFHALLLIVLLAGCRKEGNIKTSCSQLHEGLASESRFAVRKAMEHFIDELGSKDYDEQNLNKLAELMSRKCGARVDLLCFDCIQTLPSQSEIRIYFSRSPRVTRTIDLSYDNRNKIVFLAFHE